MIDIYKWQALIGAFLGAMSPFLLWWFTDIIKKRKKHFDNLYYLERLLVDQINNVLDADKTIRNFIDTKINDLIENVKKNNTNSFSADSAFFPLFSTIPLNNDIHKTSTNSGYIDNKIAKSHQLSNDMPWMIEDMRKQFSSTIELNKEIAFKKLNPPETQKEEFVQNLIRYKEVLIRDILETNFPVFIKVLTQTLVAIIEFKKMGKLKWRLKFDPRYRFFISKNKYLESRKTLFDEIEEHFKIPVKEKMAEFNR